MNHKERMSHPSDPKLTALALNLRKGSALFLQIQVQQIFTFFHDKKKQINN